MQKVIADGKAAEAALKKREEALLKEQEVRTAVRGRNGWPRKQMNAYMNERTHVCIDEWLNGWMDEVFTASLMSMESQTIYADACDRDRNANKKYKWPKKRLPMSRCASMNPQSTPHSQPSVRPKFMSTGAVSCMCVHSSCAQAELKIAQLQTYKMMKAVELYVIASIAVVTSSPFNSPTPHSLTHSLTTFPLLRLYAG